MTFSSPSCHRYEAQHFFPGLIRLRPECFLPVLVIGGLYTAQCGSRSYRAVQEQRPEIFVLAVERFSITR